MIAIFDLQNSAEGAVFDLTAASAAPASLNVSVTSSGIAALQGITASAAPASLNVSVTSSGIAALQGITATQVTAAFVESVKGLAAASTVRVSADTGPPLKKADFGVTADYDSGVSFQNSGLSYLYLDRSNLITKVLYSVTGNAAEISGNLVAINRVVAACSYGSTKILVDSLSNPEAFDWLTDGAASTIRLNFNAVAEFDVYTNKIFEVVLVVFDYGNTLGMRYRPFSIKIIKEII